MESTVAISGILLYILVLLLIISFLFITFLVVRLKNETHQKRFYKEKLDEADVRRGNFELETIKSKLNPHLFKNVLNSIQSHAYQSYYALDKLSSVLDYILYESDCEYVSLKEETDFALSLIEINRLKVSPLFDLRIKNRIDPNSHLINAKIIAPLITIDLIENAFKHADIQNADAFISIVFDLSKTAFSLIVSNKISVKPILQKEKSGFGKDNLRKRLDLVYRSNYMLEHTIENDVYIAHLKINLLEHKAQMSAAG
ncbi:histidine kinase [Dyadobacter sp. CY345]|uniref:sensor histidine kinase n=1 Tax=Dyadobacter sp. CY345 TaxID=2909335 RepID=UPI001F248ABC|nr:histidine kinase [Dyadobacter sp. CY345]MCF2443184.1 histidine kinase [Dyadobacter sp. CY345]